MKNKQLEILFLAFPIFVASLQVVFTKTNDLVSWRGGGFGMYSDPHAKTGRKIWVKGTRDGQVMAIRVYPIDERLNHNCMRNTLFSRDIDKIEDTAKYYRDFPSSIPLDPFKEYYLKFIEAYKDEELVKQYFPSGELTFEVYVEAIAPDLKHISTEKITNIPFETNE